MNGSRPEMIYVFVIGCNDLLFGLSMFDEHHMWFIEGFSFTK
jgi:hypothetical protein